MITFPLKARAPPANSNQHYRLEQSPADGGALAIAASGGDGSASIAQMYICALAGVNPWPRMPPAGDWMADSGRTVNFFSTGFLAFAPGNCYTDFKNLYPQPKMPGERWQLK